MIKKYENAINISVERINKLKKKDALKNIIIAVLLVSLLLMCIFYQKSLKTNDRACEMTKADHVVLMLINDKTLIKRKRGYAYACNIKSRCCA